MPVLPNKRQFGLGEIATSIAISLLVAGCSTGNGADSSGIKKTDSAADVIENKATQTEKQDRKAELEEDALFGEELKPVEDPVNYTTVPKTDAQKKAFAELKVIIAKAEQGEVEKALQMVRGLTKTAPLYAPVWYVVGVLAADLRQEQLAESSLKRAIALDKRYYKAWAQLGVLYANQKKYGESVRVFKRAVQLAPRTAKAWILLGRLQTEKARGEEAEKSLLRAIELEPKNGDAWYRLAYDYHCMKRFKKAESAYKKAVKYDPSNRLAWRYFGILYKDMGILSGNKEYLVKARAKLKHLTVIHPKDPMSWRNYGYIAKLQKDYKTALSAYKKSYELNKKDANSIAELARAYEMLGKTGKARELLLQARKMEPEWYRPWYNLGQLALHEHKNKEAIRLLHNAVKHAPRNAACWNTLGVAYAYEGRIDQSEKYFRRAVKINPRYILYLTNLAETLREQGKLEESRRYAEKAVRINPNSPSALVIYGLHLVADKKFDQARPVLEKAIKIDPGYVSGWRNLGAVYAQQKNARDTLRCFKKAVELDPDDMESWQNLAALYKNLGDTDNQARALKMAARSKKGRRAEDLYSIAHSLESLGHRKDASIARKAGLEMDPAEADVLLNVPYLLEQEATSQSQKAGGKSFSSSKLD